MSNPSAPEPYKLSRWYIHPLIPTINNDGIFNIWKNNSHFKTIY
ncbi:hypothetical protein ymoll0001_6320 [Yersinia mollaretii ATCC 43969]|uniref:Uncharacterized protein n=1 Tax=Yersinia mollaretii (strain ATCC 43969 / DSM 18520 / CIP 103324 / CNY 7263 / WAIP 204) TaxID=349967 RepID=A0ABP2EF57_YERMW|nr:hypothetical protein ymoll0001_6320 [Yersinia mollaretii ATCC 43969]